MYHLAETILQQESTYHITQLERLLSTESPLITNGEISCNHLSTRAPVNTYRQEPQLSSNIALAAANNPSLPDAIRKPVATTVRETSSAESNTMHLNAGCKTFSNDPPSNHTSLRLFKTTSLELTKKCRILALETTVGGERIAILLKQSFKIYKFDGQDLVELSSMRLDSHVDWRKIRIGSCYVALYGIYCGPTSRKVVSVVLGWEA